MKHLFNSIAYVNFFEMLLNEGGTSHDFREETGLAHETIRRLLFCMKQRRIIHIHAWERDRLGRHSRPSYKIGKKPDAKRPPVVSSTERHRRLHEKKRDIAFRLGVSIKQVKIRNHVLPALSEGKQSPDRRI